METKKFELPWEDVPSLIYRPGTSDEAIIKAILVDQQEYLFPKFEPKIIWDVGANIGVTAVIFANIYPEAKIYCFEPEPLNFDLLEMNTKHYKNVKCFDSGLGDKTCSKLLFKSDDPKNLGGFSTFIKGKGVVHDEVSILRTQLLVDQMGCPDLIKIDCEGAEFEILNDIPGIERVKFITGELHGVNDYGLLGLLDKHFKLQFSKAFDSPVWHFSALSKSWPETTAQVPVSLPGPQS